MKAEKAKPRPVDPEAAAKEQQRREELANSDSVQSGIAAAKEQALTNVRNEVQQRLVDLKRVSLTRDINVPGRASYDRCHASLVKAAERLAEMTGAPVSVPAWLPPPAVGDTPMVQIGAPKPPAEKIPTTMKDRGEALTRLPVFGSRMDGQLRGAGIV